MNYDFATCPPRQNTGSLKWDRYAGRDILPMWVADMDFVSSPEILDALHRRVDHAVFGYTLPPASTVAAAQEYLRTRHNTETPADHIVWFPGLVPAINIACRAFVRPGEEVLTCTPVYPPFLSAPVFAGCTLRTTDLSCSTDGTWDIDFDALEKCITPATRVFLLCNPHNPVGRIFPKSTVTRLAELCRKYDIVLVSDEIHCDLLLDGLPHTSGISLQGSDAPRTISMFAPSKTFNLAGLACSFLVIPDKETRNTFQRAARGIITEVNTLGYTACEAAFLHGWSWHKELIRVLRHNRDLLENFTSTSLPGIHTWHVEATYLAWLDTRDLHLENPTRFFEDHGVGLSDGVPFGAPSGFLRMNFGCPTVQLEESLRRMASALSQK